MATIVYPPPATLQLKLILMTIGFVNRFGLVHQVSKEMVLRYGKDFFKGYPNSWLVAFICSLLVVACQANNGATPTTVNNYVDTRNNNYNINYNNYNLNNNMYNPYAYYNNMQQQYQNAMFGPYYRAYRPNLVEGILHTVSDTVWNIGSLLGQRHY
ncbi:unnamed protein product [Pieris macdunnoughi]|uniref:Uncharacterized protein n=1 Tax=Pieris macdunnoughi TaxID=345717 RepID=A0A821XDW7_9NEOP|nr:unnamed protein product [Pieris macdunnoughi]